MNESLMARLMPPFPLEGNTSDEESFDESVNDSFFGDAVNEEKNDDIEKRIQGLLTSKRLAGVPYSRSLDFWLVQIPVSILLGAIGMIAAGIFMGSSTFLNEKLMNGCLPSGEDYGAIYSDEDDLGKVTVESLGRVGYNEGSYYWLIVMSVGGLLAALVLKLPHAPSVFTRNFIREFWDLNPDSIQAPYIILHMFIGTTIGASAGPEAAIGIIGSETGLQISNFFQFKTHTRLLMIQTGMTATLGAFTGCPLVGVLFVLELIIAGRPEDIRIKALAEKHGYTESEDESETERECPLDMELHDYSHQIAVSGIASVTAYIIFFVAIDEFVPHIRMPDFHLIMSDAFRVEHILCAIPLGMICGFIGFFATFFQGMVNMLSNKLFDRVEMLGLPTWVRPLLRLTTAGVIAGLIAVSYPITLGTGGNIVYQLIILGIGDPETATDPGIANGDEGFLSPSYLFVTALLNLFSTAIWLGSGLQGGQLMPFVVSGVLLGLSLPEYLPFYIPACIAVPCCMVSIAASMLSVPLSLSLAFITFLGLPGCIGACMFVSTIFAHSINGGMGVMNLFFEKKVRRVFYSSHKKNTAERAIDDYSETSVTLASSGKRLYDEVNSENEDNF